MVASLVGSFEERVMDVKRLDDDEVLSALRGLARDKQRNDAAMLAHLDEAERRRLFAKAGYPSMFEYCVKVLGLSENAAGKRIRVARLARRFPVIVDLVETGELHLSGLCVLGAHLDNGNYRSLLDRARGKTRRQIEALVAELAPRPDVAASITRVGGGRKTSLVGQGSFLDIAYSRATSAVGNSDAARAVGPGPESVGPAPESVGAAPEDVGAAPEVVGAAMEVVGAAPEDVGPAREVVGVAPEAVGVAAKAGARAAEPSGAGDRRSSVQQAPGPVERLTIRERAGKLPTGRADKIEVLAPERYLVKVTLGVEGKAKLERARALVSHSVPDGNLAEVIERALDALIEKTEKRRFGKGRKPRKQRRPLSEGSRTVPASVARAVVEVDGEQCSYMAAGDGHVCGSTWLLQMHHLKAFAKGGPPTVENVAIFCRAHNLYAADVEFGREFMERRRRRRTQPGSARAQATGSRASGTSPAMEVGVVWN